MNEVMTSKAPWYADEKDGQIRDANGWALASYPRNLGGPQDTANARLMAKAPELQAALKNSNECISLTNRTIQDALRSETLSEGTETALADMVSLLCETMRQNESLMASAPVEYDAVKFGVQIVENNQDKLRLVITTPDGRKMGLTYPRQKDG